MLRHSDVLDLDIVVVSEHSTRDELAEAMGHVRAAQTSCDDTERHAMLTEMLDELLGLWALAGT